MKFLELFSPAKAPAIRTSYRFSYRAKIVTLWLLILACAIFMFLFTHLMPVFIWAAVFAYLFNPLITMLSERTKIARAVYIILLYVVVAVLLFWAVKAVLPLAANEISDLTDGTFSQTSSSFIGQMASQGDVSLFGADINVKAIVINIYDWLSRQFSAQALPLLFGAVERIVFTIVFFVVTFYFLLEAGQYRKAFESVIPEPYKEEIMCLLEKINFTLGSYIRAQVFLIIIMALASFSVLYTLKIKYAIVLSIVTGILEVIPILGPISVTVLVASVALFQSTAPFGLSNPVLTLLVIACYFLLRQMEDYLVIPNIAARFVKVHPVVGILALLVGGSFGGILGLFLAIPAAAILKVFLSYIYNKLTE